MSSPAADYLKLSINSITPSSPNKFLLKLSTLNLAQLITESRGLTPSFVIQFEERFRTFKLSIVLSIKMKMCYINARPRSPIPFPLKFMSYRRELTAPQKNVYTPSPKSSLYSKLIFRKFLLASTYFLRVGPIEDLIKFLPISKETRLMPFINRYYAP